MKNSSSKLAIGATVVCALGAWYVMPKVVSSPRIISDAGGSLSMPESSPQGRPDVMTPDDGSNLGGEPTLALINKGAVTGEVSPAEALEARIQKDWEQSLEAQIVTESQREDFFNERRHVAQMMADEAKEQMIEQTEEYGSEGD